MPTGQAPVENLSLRISSRVILYCVRLISNTKHRSLLPKHFSINPKQPNCRIHPGNYHPWDSQSHRLSLVLKPILGRKGASGPPASLSLPVSLLVTTQHYLLGLVRRLLMSLILVVTLWSPLNVWQSRVPCAPHQMNTKTLVKVAQL